MKRLATCWIAVFGGLALLAGSSAATAAPTPAPLQPRLTSVTSLQCPSPNVCVGIDNGGTGDLVTSRAPRLGSAAWVSQTIGQGGRLRVLTCASAHWCLAVDQRNHVLISTDPARGATSWKIAPGGPAKHLDNVWSLSCPTSGLCVGVAGHYVVSSTQPNRGGAAWRSALVNPNAPAVAIDCPSASSCVSVSSNDQVTASSDPTARRTWTSVRLQHGPAVGGASVSCASTTHCVISDTSGSVFSTTNLNTTHPTWHTNRLGPSRYGPSRTVSAQVSCTTANVCAAARSDGSVWASPAPSGASTSHHWTPVALNGSITAPYKFLISIACVRGQLCVTTDVDGHALSANAITQPGAWRRQTIGQPRSQTGTAHRP
jgi:hypothetical protein